MKMKKKKEEITKSLAINSKDVGSAEVQIGLLSDKIEKLSLVQSSNLKQISTDLLVLTWN